MATSQGALKTLLVVVMISATLARRLDTELMLDFEV
jgi:hypothetical protein